MSFRGASVLWLSGWLWACGGATQPTQQPAGQMMVPTGAITAPSSGATAVAPQAPTGTAGTIAVAAPAATAGVAATAAAGASPMQPLAGDLPCAVATFLEMHCVECHGHKPRLGAPLPLVDAASFRGKGMSGLPLTDVVTMRVQSMERPMPPMMLLPATEIAPLLGWLSMGAPADAQGCGVHDPFAASASGAAGSGSVTSAAGSGAVASQPTQDGPVWTMFGGDVGDSRANMGEKALSPQTVSGLKELWTFKGASVTATPAIYDGIAYLPTWDGKVYALDAHSGMQRWVTSLPHLIDSSPAATPTQLFLADDRGALHALNRADGKLQWSKQADMHAEAHLWSSPIYLPDMDLVVVGVASGEEAVPQPYSFRGSVVAFDAKTGEERWRFYTTTGDASSGPGVGVWDTVAIDTTRKLAFAGTGNAYSGKPGPYVDSLLAINYQTGKLSWSRQFTMNDVFSVLGGGSGPDFDIGASPNVFTVAGKDLVGVGIKSGDYVALDRDSGQVVWMRHLTQGSVQGGVISSPAVAANKVFVASNTYPSPQTVTLFALDAMSGNVLWMNKQQNAVAYGGVTFANGVVYLGVTSGVITAYDSETGKALWMATAPDAIAGGPCVADGVLYVPWGYSWTLRMGNAGSGGLTAYGLK